MKRFILIMAALCLIASSSLFAQQSGFFIGARAGANASEFKFTEDLKELYPTTNLMYGATAGVLMGFQLNNWTLRTGLDYTQKGSKYQTNNFEDNGSVGFFTGEERLHYLSIPVLIGYRQDLVDGLGWMVSMGPSFNFGLGGNIDETTEYFGTDEKEFQNYKVKFGDGVNDDYRKVQPGFQLSPGLYLDLNQRGKLTFNVTWDWGTKDAFNPRYKQANDFFDTYKGNQKVNSTLFTIGYEYHFPFEDKY